MVWAVSLRASGDFAKGSWKATSGTWEMSSIRRGPPELVFGGIGSKSLTGVSGLIVNLNLRRGIDSEAGAGGGGAGCTTATGTGWLCVVCPPAIPPDSALAIQNAPASRPSQSICLPLDCLILESVMIVSFKMGRSEEHT